jgi:hypothetical protein
MQRKMERQIRQNKKDIAALNTALLNKNDIDIEETRKALEKVETKKKLNTRLLNDFTKQTGLKKDNSRLII